MQRKDLMTRKIFPTARRLKLGLALALAASCLAPNAFAQKKMKIFGFYPDFDLTPMLTNAQLDLLTHVIYFSIMMPADGNLTDTYVTTVPTSGQKPGVNGQKLIDVRDRAQTRGVKVLLGVGGAERSDNIGTVAGNANLRAKFASSAATFCTSNGLAGVDIDWESPYSPPGGAQGNLASLVQEISSAFKPKGLIVTISVNGEAAAAYGSAAMNAADNVLIMAYDNGDPSYNQAVSEMGTFGSMAGSKSKLVLGVPFYGRTGGATMTYSDMYKANPSLGAGTNNYQGYMFNGPDLLSQKAGYVVDQSAGGMMIWQVSQDAVTTQTAGGILLSAMNKGFTNKGATLDKVVPISIVAPNRAGRIARDRESGYLASRTLTLAPGGYRLSVVSPDGRSVRFVTEPGQSGNSVAKLAGTASGRYLYRLQAEPGALADPAE
ncbi:MAG: glycoside hydrolase family 18 [Fibrobacteres bacterium]|nr:glycoside hydrolase family 18 [Fibrobacterota bacterium]